MAGEASWETDGRKILARLPMLGTGGSGDTVYEMSYMAEETTRKYFKCFCKDVFHMYKRTYVRRWTMGEDLDEIKRLYKKKGFLLCFRCVDCS